MTRRDDFTKRHMPLRSLVPNILTVLALCAGLTAIRLGIQGNFELAAAMIIVAGVLDGIDGRVARYLKGVSKIGAELDSLADFVNFGVAPGIVLYIWVLQEVRGLGWIVVLAYVICCGLRLARFNVMSREKEENGDNDNRFFTGVPSPAGAGLVLLPLFIWLAGIEGIRNNGGLIAVYVTGVGFLFVSRLPTYTFKTILVPRDHIMVVLIASVLLVATLLTFPWISMVAVDLAYIGSMVWAYRAYGQKKP